MPSPKIANWRNSIGAKILRGGFVVVAFLIALLFGRYALATTFWSYDDEGYMLASLDRYFKVGHLYTETFSQYGPFYFFIQKAFFRTLSLPVDHDAGRLVTLVCWFGSAILAGFFIYRVSKSVILSASAGFTMMWLARVLENEPGHPEQIVQLFFMIGCCAALSGEVVSSFLLGACGAALLLTKINVGIFFLAAVAFTLVCRFPRGRIRNIGAFCMMVYAVAGPLALMHKDVPGWAWKYCLLAILIGSSTFLAGLLTTPSSRQPMRSVVSAVLGALSAALVIILGPMSQGMSVATLMEGVLWAPLRHPSVFQRPLQVVDAAVVLVILVTAGIAWLYSIRDRWPAYSHSLGILRCATGLIVIVWINDPFAHGYHGSHRSYAASLLFLSVLLPIGLIPKGKDDWQPSDFFPRLFVAALAATEILQPYPVGGAHVSISIAPLILWAFVCVHDGIDELGELVGGKDWLRGTGLGQEAAGVLFFVIIFGVMVLSGAWRPYYRVPASSLQGASTLRLPVPLEATYEFLAKSIAANCDMYFGLPGIGSMHFWTGVPTPNGVYLGSWMRVVPVNEQRKALQELQRDPQGCVVYTPDLNSFWGVTDKDLEASPLAVYILRDMRTTARLGQFEIRVNPERTTPWVSIPPAPTADGQLQLP